MIFGIITIYILETKSSQYLRTTIFQFLQLQPRNITTEVYVGLVVIYLGMVAATLHSVLQEPFTPRQKLVWSVITLVLPIIGMALYCLDSLRRADFSFLHNTGLLRRPKQRF